jgi:hypothetical protein
LSDNVPNDEVEILRRVVATQQQNIEVLEALNAQLERECGALEERLGELEEVEPFTLTARSTGDEELVYVASKTRKKFHRTDCEWAIYIPTQNLIEFTSHRAAVDAGYKPCGTCRA